MHFLNMATMAIESPKPDLPPAALPPMAMAFKRKVIGEIARRETLGNQLPRDTNAATAAAKMHRDSRGCNYCKPCDRPLAKPTETRGLSKATASGRNRRRKTTTGLDGTSLTPTRRVSPPPGSSC